MSLMPSFVDHEWFHCAVDRIRGTWPLAELGTDDDGWPQTDEDLASKAAYAMGVDDFFWRVRRP